MYPWSDVGSCFILQHVIFLLYCWLWTSCFQRVQQVSGVCHSLFLQAVQRLTLSHLTSWCFLFNQSPVMFPVAVSQHWDQFHQVLEGQTDMSGTQQTDCITPFCPAAAQRIMTMLFQPKHQNKCLQSKFLLLFSANVRSFRLNLYHQPSAVCRNVSCEHLSCFSSLLVLSCFCRWRKSSIFSLSSRPESNKHVSFLNHICLSVCADGNTSRKLQRELGREEGIEMGKAASSLDAEMRLMFERKTKERKKTERQRERGERRRTRPTTLSYRKDCN